jgi:hypothetical protein
MKGFQTAAIRRTGAAGDPLGEISTRSLLVRRGIGYAGLARIAWGTRMERAGSDEAEGTSRTLQDGASTDAGTPGRWDASSILILEVVGGPLDGLRCRVEGDALTIGRSSGNDLVLSHDPMVSSRHARIVREGDRFWLEDLGSLNGCRLDADRVDGKAPLRRGTVITIGRSRLEFLSV